MRRPDRRATIALGIVAAIAVITFGVTVRYGLVPVPSYPTVAERVDGDLHGTIAYVSYDGDDGPACVQVVRAAGGPTRTFLCQEGGLQPYTFVSLFWQPDGRLLVDAQGGRIDGQPALLLDPETGAAEPAATVPPGGFDGPGIGAPIPIADGSGDAPWDDPGSEAWVDVRSGGERRRLVSASGPRDYSFGIGELELSPDERSIIFDDTDDRLLIVATDGSSSPRVVGTELWGDAAFTDEDLDLG